MTKRNILVYLYSYSFFRVASFSIFLICELLVIKWSFHISETLSYLEIQILRLLFLIWSSHPQFCPFCNAVILSNEWCFFPLGYTCVWGLDYYWLVSIFLFMGEVASFYEAGGRASRSWRRVLGSLCERKFSSQNWETAPTNGHS